MLLSGEESVACCVEGAEGAAGAGAGAGAGGGGVVGAGGEGGVLGTAGVGGATGGGGVLEVTGVGVLEVTGGVVSRTKPCPNSCCACCDPTATAWRAPVCGLTSVAICCGCATGAEGGA